MFPAILLTTMVSMWISQGEDVGLGAAGPLMLGGDAWAFYGVILSYLRYYTNISTLFVIIISCVSSIIFISIPSSVYLNWREKCSNKEIDIKVEVEMNRINDKIINIDENKKDNNKRKKEKEKEKDDELEKLPVINEKTNLIEK